MSTCFGNLKTTDVFYFFTRIKYLYKELEEDCGSVVEADIQLQQTKMKLPEGYLILENAISQKFCCL